MRLQTEIRGHVACEAVTGDIIKIIYERLTGIDGDFDAEHERCRLRQLLDPDHALSLYGSTAAQSSTTHRSSSSYIASKRADAAAELAAKEAEYKIVQQHKKEMENQRSELGRLQAEWDMEAAQARPEAYNTEIIQMGNVQTVKSEQMSPKSVLQLPAPHPSNTSALWCCSTSTSCSGQYNNEQTSYARANRIQC